MSLRVRPRAGLPVNSKVVLVIMFSDDVMPHPLPLSRTGRLGSRARQEEGLRVAQSLCEEEVSMSQELCAGVAPATVAARECLVGDEEW